MEVSSSFVMVFLYVLSLACSFECAMYGIQSVVVSKDFTMTQEEVLDALDLIMKRCLGFFLAALIVNIASIVFMLGGGTNLSLVLWLIVIVAGFVPTLITIFVCMLIIAFSWKL